MLLSIETSCDDSAVALLDMEGNVITSQISSQTALHERYGGIVPEIASRKHLTTLPLLLRHVFQESSVKLTDLQGIAVTYAPGLIGSLLVGVSYAKTLAWIAKAPLIPVDHLEGHLLAPFLDHKKLRFPYLGLIASGGHTHLVVANGLGDYTLLGKTMDDAAGEAYDKVAKMLGFQYPGGPIIEQLAAGCSNPSIEFPVPLKGKKNLDFSFSGLKTAVRNEALARNLYVEKRRLISYEEFSNRPESIEKAMVCDIAASFQLTVEKTISGRIEKALKKTDLKQFVLTGGVAANQGIRKSLVKLAQKKKKQFFYPELEHCTDNAAMIGYTALQYLKAGHIENNGLLRLNASSKSPIGLMTVQNSE
ncbi:MAG: tRNA (adenosine(37)-N6)-threonylcarbamoyltransferase complex transferase subunit TsaD [Proteobacteria bacterium]|nr:tRNA (adenosine(37)-N6)-threonylcarbamoyltransferase complex transferase subunit TsaD [Pseudomonadota bacterium]